MYLPIKKPMWVFAVVLVCWGRSESFMLHDSPLIWSESRKIQITNKLTESRFVISLVNSCSVMAALYHKELQEDALKACNNYYNDLVLSELKQWCPQRPVVKRFEPVTLLLGFLITAAIGLGALAEINTYSNSQEIDKLAQNQNALANMTQALETQILTSSQNFDNLTEKFNSLVQKLTAFSLDHEEFKKTFVDSVMGGAHLISEFSLKKYQIRQARRLWGQGVLSEDFLEIFNAKNLCGTSCPTHLAKPIDCSFKSADQMVIKILTPVVNKDFVAVEAFSFDTMIYHGDLVCKKKYVGPKRLIMSRKGKCILRSSYSGEDEDSYGFINIQTDYRCLRDFEPQSLFNVTECRNNSNDDYLKHVQVKYLNNNFYVYCPQSVITLNGIMKNCSDSIMVIPYMQTFIINNVTYSITQNDVVIEEKYDIDLPLIAGHSLSTVDTYNFSSYMFNSTKEITPVTLNQFLYHPAVIYGGSGIVGCIFICLIGFGIWKLCFKREKHTNYYRDSLKPFDLM